MIRLCAVACGSALGGLIVFGAAAYMALMWFDCPNLIDDF